VAAIGIPIALAAGYVGDVVLAAMLAVLAGVGAWELFRLSNATGTRALEAIGIPLAALMPLGTHAVRVGWLDAPLAAAGAVFVALMGVTLWSRSQAEKPLGALAVTAFGVLYTGATLAYAYALRHHRFVVEPLAGAVLLFFPIILTWVSDTAGLLCRACLREAKAHARGEPRENGRRRGWRRCRIDGRRVAVQRPRPATIRATRPRSVDGTHLWRRRQWCRAGG
jgi:CDP-diglyceride synthetase